MWGELFENYQKELLRYASAMCRDVEFAQDLVQETFLKALKSGVEFEDLGPSQRRAWLYKTMKNLYFDHCRRAQLENAYLQIQRSETAYWEPGIQEIENELLLSMLSSEDRALFYLRYEEGYNATELSEMLQVPPGTIRARLSRSRALLRKTLSDE